MKNGVTHFISVPALYRAILEGLDSDALAPLKVVTLAGDAFSLQLLQITRQKNENIELAHEYGVTEAAVMSTLHRHQERDNRITIGQPIHNTRIYILDRYGCLQPIGIPGELSIAGTGIARGYLNNPELTAQKFQRGWHPQPIKNSKFQTNNVHILQSMQPCSHAAMLKHNHSPQYPITPSPHSPIYHTGDLARWLEDGTIEFSGRIDHQVKIRGIRVELGEIEQQLVSHGKIKDALVTVREDDAGNRYLCAYWIPYAAYKSQNSQVDDDASLPLSEPDLREYLSQRLPGSMIPSYFVRLEEVPLTANGKMDRKAVPEPEITTNDSYKAPRDEIEALLARIWSEVLGVDQLSIGIDDNFFQLGGHSLLVTQLVLKIELGFQVKIPFTELFRMPFIRRMSQYIKHAKREGFQSIPQVEAREYYPVSAAQKRMFMDQLKADDTRYNTPNMVLIEGEPDKSRIREAVKGLIRRHETLRTSFELIDGIPVQRVQPTVEPNINLTEAKENQLEAIVKGFIRPFDLAKAPLLRINLVRLQENSENLGRYIFMYDMHHIIGDGLSMNIFSQELMDLYEGVRLSGLKVQYKDFTLWQNNLLQSDSVKAQEEYWLKVFPGEIPRLELPTDYPRPALQSFAGDSITFEFSDDLSREIKKRAVESGGTLFAVLLAIFNILLSRYGRQEDIIVGTPVGARQHVELEETIGMFVNTLAIRNYPGKEKTFQQFLEEVKINSLKAFENQDYQFEELVNRLGVKRDLKRHILFDVMFAQYVPDKRDQERKIKKLVFKPYPFKNETIPFDLVLYALDMGENIVFELIYCKQLFKKETIEQMKDHLIKVAGSVVANPQVKLSRISLLSHRDKERFLQQSSKEKLKNVDIDFDF